MNFVVPHQKRIDYLNRREEEICGFFMRDFNDENVRSDFLRVLHQVKGNAQTFGFEDLGSFALKVESEVKSPQGFPKQEQIIHRLEEFKSMLSRFKQSL